MNWTIRKLFRCFARCKFKHALMFVFSGGALFFGCSVLELQLSSTRTGWRIDGEMVEIDLISFQLRRSRYICFMKCGETIEDSPLSQRFGLASTDASNSRWERLYVRKVRYPRLYHGSLMKIYLSIGNNLNNGYSFDEADVRSALVDRVRLEPEMENEQ